MFEFLPDKFTPIQSTVVGHSAFLLGHLRTNKHSVATLFVVAKDKADPMNFDAFTIALTFLFASGLIDYVDGILGVN